MGGLVGIIFGFAAVLGAMNTMNAQVSSRTRELGALRAVGFRPRAILTSLVLESVLLGMLGGSIGIGTALLLQGVELRLTSEKTMTEMSYTFHFSLAIATSCLAIAAFIGFAGGLLPALRASRMRIVDAVRAD
jgi:ABC-type antimicrobial peptide transport system permease subunit